MKSQSVRFALALWALSIAANAWAQGNACTRVRWQAIGAGSLKTPIAELKELTIVSANVENLMWRTGKAVLNPDGTPKLDANGKPILEHVGIKKSPEDTAGVVRALEEIDAAIINPQEVEDQPVLQEVIEERMEDAFRAFLRNGNDFRGIDAATLVRKDLTDIVWRLDTHIKDTWQDPTQPSGQETQPLFSRDFVAMRMLPADKPSADQPIAVFFNTHLKSKRDRPNDPESRILWKAQIKRAGEIIKAYREKYGRDVLMMVSGDFNEDVATSPEFKQFLADTGMVLTFDALPTPVADRTTHAYFPKNGPPHYAQMDVLAITKEHAGLVKDSRVHRFIGTNGQELPQKPATYADRSKQPSDHHFIQATIRWAEYVKERLATIASIVHGQ